MDIREYIRMLKRGWPVVVLAGVLFVVLASVYLALTPKQYASTAVLKVSARDPITVVDLQQGNQFSVDAANTYAQIIDSSTVLGPVAAGLRPQLDVDNLIAMVTTTVRTGTTLINITATGQDPAQVAQVANAAASSAITVIPALERVGAGPSLVRIQQIVPAVQPSQAVSPNSNRILVLGCVVGLCLGLAATITSQALDTRIRRVQDLRALTTVPLLAVLPRVRRSQQHGVVVRYDPTGASGEAFRTLRTNVRFLGAENQRILVFTAVADSSDGAHVPTNLAWMLAEAGYPVLLVDLDLRRSTVGDTMGIEAGSGMADVLAGKVKISDVVHPTGHDNLHVLLSGTSVPNPSELVSAPVMTSTLRWMEKQYEYVILHAPPLLSFSDAAVLSGAAGGTFVTVTTGRTRAQELNTALTVLSNVGVSPLGLVLTRAGVSALDHGKARGGPTRFGPRRGGMPMRHRLDWDWRRGGAERARRHAVR